MVERDDSDRAERLSTRRARMLPVLACVFLAQQASYFSGPDMQDRAVDHFKIAAWIVLSVVLLVVLLTGGGWLRSRRVREMVNDEVTRAHRDAACRAGFVASMAACIVLYFVSLFEPLGGRTAVHLVMTAGLSVALCWFGVLERRANRDA